MNERFSLTAIFVATMLTAAPLVAQELEDTDPAAERRTEIRMELEARIGDLERTRARLTDLNGQAQTAAERVDDARMDVLEIEKRLAADAALLYRLSRHGKALRYLFSAGSGTSFLRRVKTLKRLVITGLEERRRCGFALTEAETELASLREEITAAETLLNRLDETRRDLEQELASLDTVAALE